MQEDALYLPTTEAKPDGNPPSFFPPCIQNTISTINHSNRKKTPQLLVPITTPRSTTSLPSNLGSTPDPKTHLKSSPNLPNPPIYSPPPPVSYSNTQTPAPNYHPRHNATSLSLSLSLALSQSPLTAHVARFALPSFSLSRSNAIGITSHTTSDSVVYSKGLSSQVMIVSLPCVPAQAQKSKKTAHESS